MTSELLHIDERSGTWFAVASLVSVGLGLSQRPSVLGAMMFGFAAVAALFFLGSTRNPEDDFILITYFFETSFLALFGLLALLFAPRPGPCDPSPFD